MEPQAPRRPLFTPVPPRVLYMYEWEITRSTHRDPTRLVAAKKRFRYVYFSQ